MPIYEYRCQECGKVFSLLFLRLSMHHRIDGGQTIV